MKQPIHRIPRRALNRPRTVARSGVAIAKELVRSEFEKQRLKREIDRLGRRLEQCEREYAHNSEQSLMFCAELVAEDKPAG